MELHAVIQALRNNPSGVRFQELTRYWTFSLVSLVSGERATGCIALRGLVIRG